MSFSLNEVNQPRIEIDYDFQDEEAYTLYFRKASGEETSRSFLGEDWNRDCSIKWWFMNLEELGMPGRFSTPSFMKYIEGEGRSAKR